MPVLETGTRKLGEDEAAGCLHQVRFEFAGIRKHMIWAGR